MSIKLARIYEAHHCVSWLTVHSVLQSLGPAPALQQRLWARISGPAAHWASSSRTPGHSCLAKLISGCLSELMDSEEQKALHCPHSPSCGHSPLPLTPCWLPDSLSSSAEEVCNVLFVHPSAERHPNTGKLPEFSLSLALIWNFIPMHSRKWGISIWFCSALQLQTEASTLLCQGVPSLFSPIFCQYSCLYSLKIRFVVCQIQMNECRFFTSERLMLNCTGWGLFLTFSCASEDM